MFSKDKVTEIFYHVDEFCKEFSSEISKARRITPPEGKKTRARALTLSDSEIITILICFHLGSHRTFKQYYNQVVKKYWSDLFPKTLSDNRFIEVQTRFFLPMALFIKQKCLGKCAGINFMDSTTLKVCKNQRIHQHKVFKDWAARGKSSMGWTGRPRFTVLNFIFSVMKREKYSLFI